MIFQNSLNGHRQAWKLLHKKTSLTDAETTDIVNLDTDRVKRLWAAYDRIGDSATGNFWADRNKPTIN